MHEQWNNELQLYRYYSVEVHMRITFLSVLWAKRTQEISAGVAEAGDFGDGRQADVV